MIVSYTHEIPMGHRLMRHAGKCRFIHGHNYLVQVRVRGNVAPISGMVIDFHHLKTATKNALEMYDHAFVIEDTDPVFDDLQSPREPLAKLIKIPYAPTAENLAELWAREIDMHLHVLCPEIEFTLGTVVMETRDAGARFELNRSRR